MISDIVPTRWRMQNGEMGSEQFTDEDRAYSGSRFQDVVAALFANPYQQVWARGRATTAGSRADHQDRLRRTVLAWQAAALRARLRTNPRLSRRPALGARRQGLPTVSSSDRRLPRGPVADHGRHTLYGTLRARQFGPGRSPVFERRRRQPARSRTIHGARRQALSDDGPPS